MFGMLACQRVANGRHKRALSLVTGVGAFSGLALALALAVNGAERVCRSCVSSRQRYS